MWPADALWDLGERLITLVVLLLAWALVPRADLKAGDPLVPQLSLERRARPLWAVVALAALFTGSGWLAQASSLGAAQTLAMALGGPHAEEIYQCRAGLARAAATGVGPACPWGGRVSARPEGGWVCDKHGAPSEGDR
jgi:hypothetical protein